jgi:hypothetical protein
MDPWYGDADRQYIGTTYRKLADLATRHGYSMAQVHHAIAAADLPCPPYILNDEAWVADDYFSLWESARTQGVPVQQLFQDRYCAARKSLDGEEPDCAELEDAWRDYLGGDYGVCLWEATPENIVRKGHLMTAIRALIQLPRPEDPVWQQRLRQSVAALDRLERPFAAGDRLRFGAVSSRTLYVEAPPVYFPEAFGVGAP